MDASLNIKALRNGYNLPEPLPMRESTPAKEAGAQVPYSSPQEDIFCSTPSEDSVTYLSEVPDSIPDIKRMKEMDGTSAAVRDKYTEANWGYLMRKIGFKAEEAGSRMILVDPRYTSRTCSRCGHVVQSLSPTQRTFACETCGNVIDRDWNAAINILNRGLGVEAVRKENGRRGRQHGC